MVQFSVSSVLQLVSHDCSDWILGNLKITNTVQSHLGTSNSDTVFPDITASEIQFIYYI